MGQFLNPDNQIFLSEAASSFYVDKTGLISITNRSCGTSQQFILSSRPRRFGKSYVADMLTAYYSRGCNSRKVFEPFDIAKDPSCQLPGTKVPGLKEHMIRHMPNHMYFNLLRYSVLAYAS